MHIVSYGDDLHEMSKPVEGEKKEKYCLLSSAELAQGEVMVKE